ncbi:MAG: hypothetical protein E6G60_09250 [Actinobacteria bacterium]|nr:MAG: hypothetical protein E6G60_09250 [Actinomycetota bacterium]
MTDDFDISPPNADADDGDERLRALLAVAPLDEVTRRRLVTTAIAAARPEDEAARGPRSHRRVAWLSAAVAATVAALAVITIALAGGGNDSVPRAARTSPESRARATNPSPATGSTDQTSPLAGATSAAGKTLLEGGVRNLGNLGQFASASALRTTVEHTLRSSTEESGAAPSFAMKNVAPNAALACATTASGAVPGFVTFEATGTATVRGRAALVFVARTDDGRHVLIVVRQANDGTCDVRTATPLG